MEKQPLHELLETLHGQLHEAEAMSAEDQALLRDIAHDIQVLLERAQAGQELGPDAPLLARLSQAVRQFEISHPYLTLGLAQLLDTLSRAGV
jgi:hypothetical protein